MPVQDAKLRATNFEEVALGYSPEQARDEALRCLNCKNKPCVSGCPVAVDHPGLFGKGGGRGRRGCLRLYFGVEQPARRVRQGVPAENQCEKYCTRGNKGEPVAIGRVERYVADRHLAGHTEAEAPVTPNGHRVAIVGAGPAGLTCAGDLARLGYA